MKSFLASQRRRERLVPRFVDRELRKFLECGVLAHGFLRVHCDICGGDRVVAFSCGGRMRILAAIHSPDAIREIPECLGLPSRAPPISPALEDEDDFSRNRDYLFE